MPLFLIFSHRLLSYSVSICSSLSIKYEKHMSPLVLAEVVFFLVFGISHFIPFRYSADICAVAAIVIGVLLIVRF